MHGSLCLGDMLYAICGNTQIGCFNSIERVNAASVVNKNQSAEWEIIHGKFVVNDLPHRYNAVVAPVSDTEFAILGGLNRNGYPLGDGYIFNTDTLKIDKVFHTEFKFSTQGN